MLTTIRTSLEARRAARRERKVLASELAHYVTDADRFDLEAMLDRYPDDQTLEIRQMLARQAVYS